MKTIHNYLICTLVAGSLLLAAGLVRSADPVKNTPHGVAVINVSRVFGSLNEKLAADSEIDGVAKTAGEEKRKREEEIEALGNQLKGNTLFRKDSPEFKKMQDDILEKSMSLQTFVSFSQQKIMLQERLKTEQIYMSINAAVKAYAESSGIGLVFATNDADFSQDRTVDAINQHIALRKVMYNHPDYDITQNVIEKMNADYKLGNK